MTSYLASLAAETGDRWRELQARRNRRRAAGMRVLAVLAALGLTVWLFVRLV